jgi:hypothetical protein
VKIWFQAFCFLKCNLYRYAEGQTLPLPEMKIVSDKKMNKVEFASATEEADDCPAADGRAEVRARSTVCIRLPLMRNTALYCVHSAPCVHSLCAFSTAYPLFQQPPRVTTFYGFDGARLRGRVKRLYIVVKRLYIVLTPPVCFSPPQLARLQVALIGRSNVGKSSLLNLLTQVGKYV